jgi:hypothetical protein
MSSQEKTQPLVSAYQRMIRSWLPSSPIVYAGVPICYDRKWGDTLVPSAWLPELEDYMGYADEPEYEAALVTGLNESVKPGDRVVVVGGGVGVTAVIAAFLTGSTGTVECFEGSKRYIARIQETALRNKVSNIRVHHAVVAKPIGVYGDQSGHGGVIPPDQLPECDVLELDCEGAEVEILRSMVIQPRVIIVETHGNQGAPTPLVESLLKERGYAVRSLGYAEPRLGNICVDNDIQVLLATRTGER